MQQQIAELKLQIVEPLELDLHSQLMNAIDSVAPTSNH